MTSVPLPHTLDQEIDNAKDQSASPSPNPITAVNFSGEWRLDKESSSSLTELMKYHGLTDEKVLKYAQALVPTLVIQHTKGKLITEIYTDNSSDELSSLAQSATMVLPSSLSIVNKSYQSDAKSPLLSNNSHALNYSDAESSQSSRAKPTAREEYLIDGHYHTVKLKKGTVQSRCYIAPHGQSLIVDTKCANYYDLERTERYLVDNGEKMILEIRILTCDPDRSISDHALLHSENMDSNHNLCLKPAVATPFIKTVEKPIVVAANNIVVNELLFIQRVFNRIS
jgi:hypothetical protein